MYKIIGADRKEYGPISTEQLRFWITEGRVNAQTQACAEGTTDWKPLSAFPDFADALGLGAGTAAETSSVLGASSVTDAAGREQALRAVKGPAIALIVTASIGLLYYAASGLITLLGGGAMFQQPVPPDLPPQIRGFIEGMQGPFAGAINLVIACINAFVIFGAIKLMRLQSFSIAMVACVVAMLPCQCCCLLGLPFGIWALVVMNKPHIKKWFV